MDIKIKNRPFLKWAGGKYRLVDEIKKVMPSPIEGRYVESFLGAGSMALNVNADNVIVNDINPNIFLVWRFIQTSKDLLLEELTELFSGKYNNRESYEMLRNEHNSYTTGNLRNAALFIYLNKHCFNGLCRYNDSGKFNVPFGRYTTVKFPKEEIENASNIIKNWDIRCTDFRDVMMDLKLGDICYCDPPYSTLTPTSNFNGYSKEKFDDAAHTDLAGLAAQQANRGAKIIISNNYTEFTKNLYQRFGAIIHTFNVSRTIAAKSESRKPVTEMLAVFDRDKWI